MSISEDEEIAIYEAFLSDPDPRLIAPAKNSTLNVELLSSSNWREHQIWEGYLDASMILLREALQREPRASLAI